MDSLRHALRRLAKAVVVITSADASARYAMAATAVSELSFEPPSMLVCVNRTASLYPPLAAQALVNSIVQAATPSITGTARCTMQGSCRPVMTRSVSQ